MRLLLAKNIANELIEETVKTLTDENKLMDIIKNDENIFEIRQLATKQITNNDLLKEIIFDTSNTTYTKNMFDIRETAVKQITDEELLFEIVNNYYDDNVNTKYGLNIAKEAVKKINSKEMLINIAENDYDEEIINLAVEKTNDKYEEDKNKLELDYNDDSKVNRMYVIDQINDDETLLDIAMNANYLDIREKALNKIKMEHDTKSLLKDLILEEKEYNDAMNEYITSDEDDNANIEDIINKASNLEVQYKRAGNPEKEKFYNQQCKLLKNKK